MNLKVISGGQTGVDQIALSLAQELGYETGGTAPKGFKTESGPAKHLGIRYGLIEHSSTNYVARTKANIVDSDATVVFNLQPQRSKGSALTVVLCRELGKPCLVYRDKQQATEFFESSHPQTLNFAGNRMSHLRPSDIRQVKRDITEVLELWSMSHGRWLVENRL